MLQTLPLLQALLLYPWSPSSQVSQFGQAHQDLQQDLIFLVFLWIQANLCFLLFLVDQACPQDQQSLGFLADQEVHALPSFLLLRALLAHQEILYHLHYPVHLVVQLDRRFPVILAHLACRGVLEDLVFRGFLFLLYVLQDLVLLSFLAILRDQVDLCVQEHLLALVFPINIKNMSAPIRVLIDMI